VSAQPMEAAVDVAAALRPAPLEAAPKAVAAAAAASAAADDGDGPSATQLGEVVEGMPAVVFGLADAAPQADAPPLPAAESSEIARPIAAAAAAAL